MYTMTLVMLESYYCESTEYEQYVRVNRKVFFHLMCE